MTSPSHPIGLTDAVGLTPSLIPRLGAVAITVTTTALDRVPRSGSEWCGVGRRVRPGVRVWSGRLARDSVGVGLVLTFEVHGNLWGSYTCLVCQKSHTVFTDTHSHSHKHFTHQGGSRTVAV